MKQATLLLEDGTILKGNGFGAETESHGEVVFNTGMTGYVESLTDPSYAGQVLVQTYPLIGNYGVPDRKDRYDLPYTHESSKVQVSGYVVSDLAGGPSHWANDSSLDKWLTDQGIPGIYGLDTRMLTKKLRTRGVMLGIIKVGDIDEDDLLGKADKIPDPNHENLVGKVSIKEAIVHKGDGKKVVVIDCGVKYGIIRNLLNRGCEVIRVPYDSSIDEVMSHSPDGVVVSNGPGDPDINVDTIKTLAHLIDESFPVMGICLGNQMLALAAGAKTYKLKYGHRGQNHPCTDVETGKSIITSQNHGFGVEIDSLLDTGFKSLFVNTNDGTLEGIRHMDKPIFAVQFHPEGSPGPLDAGYLFDEFMKETKK